MTIERPDNPPPPSEALLVDGIVEVPLTPSQLLMLSQLAAQAATAAEAADAVAAIARAKQSALDQALKMVFDVAGVDPGDTTSLLDRQHSVVRLVPKNALPR